MLFSPLGMSAASFVHSQATIRAGSSGGCNASIGSLLTGLIPDARIAVCIAVRTVPGEKPYTRRPCSPYSSASARVSMTSPALELQ